MKKVIIILGAVLLFTACKKTDINGSTYYYTGIGPKTTMVLGCPIDTTQLVFKPVDTLYSINPLNKNLQDFSVSFWMKTIQKDSSNAFPNFTFIIDRDVWGPVADWSIGLFNGGYIAAHGGHNEGNMLVTKNQYNDNVYHHIVVIYNPSLNKRSIYVDNKMENTDVTLTKFVFENINQNVSIGQSSVEPESHKKYLGNLKNIRIYSKPLSVCEIEYLYNIKP